MQTFACIISNYLSKTHIFIENILSKKIKTLYVFLFLFRLVAILFTFDAANDCLHKYSNEKKSKYN